MPKNPLKEIMGFMKTNKPSTQEKQNDFERAKEVLFSSKTPQQLISAVKYINNFNKKHGITETSPEFIYFDKMILVMKLKIKSKTVEGGEQIDEASRMNRGIRNIIKSLLYESLDWSDKDETFDTDKSFSNDQSWSNDPEWELNPDKSYWKQGEVGGSSGGEDVSESEDGLDWIRDTGGHPNYDGHPQGVVYLYNHDEIDEFCDIIENYNGGVLPRGDARDELHYGLDGVTDYDMLSVSFFVEKDEPGVLTVGYWDHPVKHEDINEWFSWGDTFNEEYELYTNLNQVRELFRDYKNPNLIGESEDEWGWANEKSFMSMEQLLDSVNKDELDIFIGKTVILSPDSEYYKEGIKSNPRETEGYIENINIAYSLPIEVNWSNGTYNSYKVKDLLIMI
jgi:hypothetical protein